MKYLAFIITFTVFIPTTSSAENGIASTPDATQVLESQNLGQTLLKDLDEKIKADQASWATQDAALQKPHKDLICIVCQHIVHKPKTCLKCERYFCTNCVDLACISN